MHVMKRRDALKVLLLSLARPAALAAAPAVSTLIGSGSPGYSDREVNNPYGLAIGPGGALYFCDLDNQRIRRLDLKTGRTVTIAGNGQRAYAGDGAAATEASLNMPHEIQFDAAGHLYIAERDNHVIRKVDAKTGMVTTFAGTGQAGFAGDGGPAVRAQLRQPHSIAVAPGGRRLLVCDIGNHRIRQIDLATGVIDRLRRHRRAAADAGWRPVAGHATERSADDRVRSGRQPVRRASRRQRHLSDRCPATNPAPRGWHRGAGILR